MALVDRCAGHKKEASMIKAHTRYSEIVAGMTENTEKHFCS